MRMKLPEPCAWERSARRLCGRRTVVYGQGCAKFATVTTLQPLAQLASLTSLCLRDLALGPQYVGGSRLAVLWALTQLRELRVFDAATYSMPLSDCFARMAALERMEVHGAKLGPLAPSAAGGCAPPARAAWRAFFAAPASDPCRSGP